MVSVEGILHYVQVDVLTDSVSDPRRISEHREPEKTPHSNLRDTAVNDLARAGTQINPISQVPLVNLPSEVGPLDLALFTINLRDANVSLICNLICNLSIVLLAATNDRGQFCNIVAHKGIQTL